MSGGRARALGFGFWLHACTHAPPADPDLEPPATAAVEPEAPTRPELAPPAMEEPAPETAASSPVEQITGIPSCDAYLDLYRRCEKRLEPEIMSGNRRFYRVERASLEHLMTTPERAGLPESCDAMLQELRPACPEAELPPR